MKKRLSLDGYMVGGRFAYDIHDAMFKARKVLKEQKTDTVEIAPVKCILTGKIIEWHPNMKKLRKVS